MLLKMAWLNIWRNPRRTIILLCAAVVGLAGIVFTIGFMNSWIVSMVDTVVDRYEGHIKISGRGYRANPIIENHMSMPSMVADRLNEDDRIKAWTERVAIEGLVANARRSASVSIVGIDPEKETLVSVIGRSVREGKFLSQDRRNGILVGRRLAEKFGTKLKRRLVLRSQRLGGEIGDGAFKVIGIFDTGDGSFDESIVYILKSDAQQMLGLKDEITEAVLVLNDIDQSDNVARELRDMLLPVSSSDERGRIGSVTTWKQAMPLVVKTIELSSQSMIVFYAIFYLAMAFGILNTLMMSIGERTYEFGVLLSIGMKRRKIVSLILLESFFVATMAVMIGTAIGYGLVHVFGRTGMDFTVLGEAMEFMKIGKVLYPSVSPKELMNAAVATFVVSILFSIYPAVKASRMVPVEALRHVG